MNGGIVLQGNIQQVVKDERLNAASDRGTKINIKTFETIKPDEQYIGQESKKSILYNNISQEFAVVLLVKHSAAMLWQNTDDNGETGRIIANQKRMRRMSTLGTRSMGSFTNQQLVATEKKLGQDGILIGMSNRPSDYSCHLSMRLMPKDLARQMAGSVRWFP